MVEFKTMYEKKGPKLEEPILSIKELGVTVPENDPSGRFKNVVQGVQAAFRQGVGKIQLVFNMSHQSAIGGRPKSLGPDVREKLREVALANDAMIVGVELPTSLSNLTGFDMQRGELSEETRQEHLNEVRDAIKFTADVAQGGSVDILSWEFPRTIIESSWNDPGKDSKWGGKFRVADEEKKGEIRLVDVRTGATASVGRKGIPPPVVDEKQLVAFLKKTNPEMKEQDIKELAESKKSKTWDWQSYKDLAKQTGEDPIEMLKKAIFERQTRIAEREIAVRKEEVEEYKERLEKGEIPENKKAFIKEVIQKDEAYIEEQKRQIAENTARSESLQPLDKIAKAKAIESYAEAGMMAMQETHNNPNIKRPVHVGPELGWPQFWGSHPQEFKELILESRKKMADVLKDKYGYTPEQAREQAKVHIKGTLDTSHLGMWLDKFMPEEKNWNNKLEKFKDWFKEQVKDLAKADVIGTVQLVDSMSGAHEHLPAGQGILPIVEAAKILKDNGFSGYFISEGHGEEKFGEGRIFTETWKAFNAPIESKYGNYAPRRWNEVDHSYAGRVQAPVQMFGSYTPPRAEYRPWAGGKEPISFE